MFSENTTLNSQNFAFLVKKQPLIAKFFAFLDANTALISQFAIF